MRRYCVLCYSFFLFHFFSFLLSLFLFAWIWFYIFATLGKRVSEWVRESFLLFPFFSKYRRIFGFCRRRRQTHTLVSFGSANGPMVWRSNCNDFWILNLFFALSFTCLSWTHKHWWGKIIFNQFFCVNRNFYFINLQFYLFFHLYNKPRTERNNLFSLFSTMLYNI